MRSDATAAKISDGFLNQTLEARTMPKWLIVLLFVAGAALSWGVYVPLVHRASTLLQSNLRAFLFVGVAYFLVAVLVPIVLIFVMDWDPTQRAAPNFRAIPVLWGLLSGIAGAAGALFVIFAVTNAGPGGAIYVAPLVFGGAPIINTLATIYYFHPVKTLPDWKFFLGLGLAVVGAAMVMLFKPADEAHAAAPAKTAVAPAEAGAAVH
jgi:drug/metabolite transporter (DMT)-like permease